MTMDNKSLNLPGIHIKETSYHSLQIQQLSSILSLELFANF
jgi:hypothetical protein